MTNSRSRKFILIIVDIFLIVIAYVLAFEVRFENIQERNWNSFISLLPWIILISLFFITMYELYSLERKSNWDIIRNVNVASTLMMFLTMAASFLFREFALPRTVILLAYFFINILFICWKLLFVKLCMNKVAIGLFVGNEQEINKISKQMEKSLGKKSKMQYLSSNAAQGHILNNLYLVDYIILGSSVPYELKSNIINQTINMGKIVYVIPDFYDLILSKSMNTTIDDTMVMGVKPFGLSWDQQIIKRLYDFVISLIALVVCSPIMVLIGILIKLEDPKGNVIYKQERIGRYNKNFTIYKFRSMIEGAENKSGPTLARENDPRITKIGGVIRKTRIDELPQFINVLKGDMSIVGPRPEREFFVRRFEKDIKPYSYRNNVKPGITGYAQIMGKYTTSVEDKLRFDLFYIRNYSFLLDIIIQFRTIIVLFDKAKTEGKQDFENGSTHKGISL